MEVTNANAAQDLNQIPTQYTSVKVNDFQLIFEVDRPFCEWEVMGRELNIRHREAPL